MCVQRPACVTGSTYITLYGFQWIYDGRQRVKRYNSESAAHGRTDGRKTGEIIGKLRPIGLCVIIIISPPPW